MRLDAVRRSRDVRIVKDRSEPTVGPYAEGMWTGIVVVIVIWAIVSMAGSSIVGPLWLVAMGAALLAGALLTSTFRQHARRPSA